MFELGARQDGDGARLLRLLAPAERPMSAQQLALAADAFEAEGTTRLPPRSSSLPRRGTDLLDPDLAAGLAEAQEHGFVRTDPDGRLALRHELVAAIRPRSRRPVRRLLRRVGKRMA